MNELATNCGLFYSQKRLGGNEKQKGWLCEAGAQFYRAFLFLVKFCGHSVLCGGWRGCTHSWLSTKSWGGSLAYRQGGTLNYRGMRR